MYPFYNPCNFYQNFYPQPEFNHFVSPVKQEKAAQLLFEPVQPTDQHPVKQQVKQNLIKVEENFESESTNSKKLKIEKQELEKYGYQVTKHLWSQNQDKLLIRYIEQEGKTWKEIAKLLTGRNPKMCYNRYKRLNKKKKVLWTQQQDQKLKTLVQVQRLKWKSIQKQFKNRKAKQLRQRYLNFLRSNLTRGPWTVKQDLKLIQCINLMGKKWKKIEDVLVNRSENQIKNRYYGRIQHLLKKGQQTLNS